MNRRSFFGFLAVAPLGAVAATASTPLDDILVEGPDWHLLSCIPSEAYAEFPDRAEMFQYATVTDASHWTRAAVRAGWHRIVPQIERTWTDTQLPCAIFCKWQGPSS